MKLIMENWRKYLYESNNPLAAVYNDRDVTDLLAFVKDTVELLPDGDDDLKKLISSGQVLHRWSTKDENDLHPGTIAWVQKIGDSKIVVLQTSEYRETVEGVHEALKPSITRKGAPIDSYIRLLKAATITLIAGTVVHEYAHHVDPSHVFQGMDDTPRTDDSEAESGFEELQRRMAMAAIDSSPSTEFDEEGNPLDGEWQQTEIQAREDFAQFVEKEYKKKIYFDTDYALNYIIDNIDDNIKSLIDSDKLIIAMKSFYKLDYDSSQY